MEKVDEKKKFIVKFTIIALTVILIVSIVSTTFAWYIDYKNQSATLELGKVELSENSVYTTSLNLGDVIAGTEILSEPLKVGKKSDSVPIYVRAKLSFKIAPGQNPSRFPILYDYIDMLRKDTEFNFYRVEQGNGNIKASWSYKYGNYIYLVYSIKDGPNDNGANNYGERMFPIKDDYVYTLTKSIKMPMSINQDSGRTQFGRSIIFNFAFQAVQAVELVDYEFSTIQSIFDEAFPEDEEEETDYKEYIKDALLLRRYELSSSLNDTLGNTALSGGDTDYEEGAYSLLGREQSVNITEYVDKSKFSFCFWAKMKNTSYTVGSNLLTLKVRAVDESLVPLSFEACNTAGTLLDLKGGNFASEGVKQVATSTTKFYHYAVVADGLKFKLYVNGELAGFMTYLEEGWKLTGEFILGGEGMFGLIKDLRIYDGVVSDYQVTNMYNGN